MELHVTTQKSRYVIKRNEHPDMFMELINDNDKLEYFKGLIDDNPLTAYNIYNNIEITGE